MDTYRCSLGGVVLKAVPKSHLDVHGASMVWCPTATTEYKPCPPRLDRRPGLSPSPLCSLNIVQDKVVF